MKYSDHFKKQDWTKGPYPIPHTVGGKKLPPDGDAQPRLTGDVLLSKTDDMPIAFSYGQAGCNNTGNFGPCISRCGEGLPNSFNLDFTNNMTFSAGNCHPHTGLMLFTLALNLRPQNIIETGTYYGYSTMYLAKVCEIWKEGTVWTIDTQDKHISEEIKNNKYVRFVKGDSRIKILDILKKIKEVQFAFLDSWKRIAYTEFKLIEPYMAEGGIFAFHDTQLFNTGRSLFDEVTKNYSDTYDITLFSAFPHNDNKHRFLGNADDRGLLIMRKKPSVDPFYNVPDYGSRQMGARLV